MTADHSNMLTPMETSSEINEANNNILADLIVKADADENSKEVRDCLRAYKLGNHTKTLEAAFNKFKRAPLIKTLGFLNIKHDKMEKYKKQEIITELICRIENLLLDKCGMCGNQFATALNEKLLLQCKLCGQNAHLECLKELLGESYHSDLTHEDVSRLINPLGLDGLHYLCDSCSNSTIPSESGLNAGSKSQNAEDSSVIADGTNQQTDRTSDNAAVLKNAVVHEENNKPWRDRSDLCALFLQSKCPHGITGKQCENFHPRVCNQYRKNGNHPKYGCRKGNACNYYHPDICPNSMKSHTCLNHKCVYRWHLPHTIRVQNTRSRHSHNMQYPNNFKKYSNHQVNTRGRYRNSNHQNWKEQGHIPKRNFNNFNSNNNSNSNNVVYDVFNTNDFPLLGSAPQREGGRLGGDNRHNFSRPYPNNGSCYVENTDRSNDNNHSFPFLEQKLQESIAQQVQAAFQQINLPNQIQQELYKLHQGHSNKDTNTQLLNSTDPSVLPNLSENQVAGAVEAKVVQPPLHMNPLQSSQQAFPEFQPLLQHNAHYQQHQAHYQGLVNQRQY